jgi:hypothetical protein
MTDRSRVMTQTESDLFFQVGRWAVTVTNLSSFKISYLRSHIIYVVRINVAKSQGKVIRTMITILLLGMYSVCIEQER